MKEQKNQHEISNFFYDYKIAKLILGLSIIMILFGIMIYFADTDESLRGEIFAGIKLIGQLDVFYLSMELIGYILARMPD